VSEQPTIVVVGTGTTTSVPDQCVVTVALNAIGTTPAEALDLCAAAADRAIAALVHEGVERRDVRTTNLSVQDFFDQAAQKVTARLGSYQLEITVRSLGRVAGVVAALSDAGGDALQVRSLHLTVSEREPLRQEAMRLAVRNATARAHELADAAGLRLGEILLIQDYGAFGGPQYPVRNLAMETSGQMGPSLPLEPGEISASASVTMTIAVSPKAPL
jgi:uncharacterized protein YggE